MIKNVHGNTVDFLGEAIVAGRYGDGGAMPPEPSLCEELGVSRTVVRESVKSLVAKGLVQTGPKVGTRVMPSEHWNWFDPDVIAWQVKAGLTPEFVRDLQDLRLIVEPAAIRMAAQRATAADVVALRANIQAHRDSLPRLDEFLAHDMAFHRALARISGNPIFPAIVEALFQWASADYRPLVRAPGAELLTLEEHSRVVDAIAAGDADAAAAAMRAHLARSNALYRRIEEAQDRPS